MKARYIVLLIAWSILLTAGGTGFGYFLAEQMAAEEIAENSSQPAGSVAGQSTLNVAGDQQTGSSSLPEPSEYGVYEQYANESSALVQDIVVGNGQEVGPGDTVAMVYQGWLTNGQLFDQSRANEQGQVEPFVFTIGSGQVIRGWDQGISGMKVGGRRRLIVPASVGYGSSGQGSIPPNSMLVFDVELVQAQNEAAANSGL